MISQRDQRRAHESRGCSGNQDRSIERTAKSFQPADKIYGRADRREIQAVGGANIAPENLAEVHGCAKGQRRQALLLPRCIEMRHSNPGGGSGAEGPVARGAWESPTTGKIASTPSPRNFSTSPPKACTAPAIRSNQASSAAITTAGGADFGQGGEAAQIGAQQRGQDDLAASSPQWTRKHPRGATPAEICLECGGQRRPRHEGGERGDSETSGLPEAIALGHAEWSWSNPAKSWRVGTGPDYVLVRRSVSEFVPANPGRQQREDPPAFRSGTPSSRIPMPRSRRRSSTAKATFDGRGGGAAL